MTEAEGLVERPTLLPPRTSDEPEWQQVNDLFARHGMASPDWRMRDELVGWLVWVRYGQAAEAQLQRLTQERDAALAAIATPEAVRVNILRGTIKAPPDLVWLHDTNSPVAQRLTASLEDAEEALRREREKTAAVITLLYSDEVFVGSHWEGDFRDPATKVWPALCAHFPNYGSDGEEIPEDQLVPLAALVREFGSDAVLAWVCEHRGLEKPPKGGLSESGRNALAAIRSRKEKA